MILTAVLGAAAWVALGVGVSSLMARRGYDRTAWLVVGVLFGPIAVFFASLELLGAFPRRPEVVDPGRGAGGGNLDVLVVANDAASTNAARVLGRLDVRRLVLARILSFDGAKDMEKLAAEQLRRDRLARGRPAAELVLLFGVPVDAIAGYAAANRIDAVLVDRAMPGLASRLSPDIMVLEDEGLAAFEESFQGVLAALETKVPADVRS